jgi:serine kinase of HPr protein (carbohydrate metabolism regulator)
MKGFRFIIRGKLLNKGRDLKMLTVNDLVEKLELKVVTTEAPLDRPVAGGYASDLLSCAMNKAKKDYAWITLQSHMNVVAVASLLGLACIIITENGVPDSDTLIRAEKEKVPLLVTAKTTYTVAGELYTLGITGD